MRRREFFVVVGVARGWPFTARAQQAERVRRIGVLTGGGGEDDLDAQARMAAFVQELQQLGWTDGHNVRIDNRWDVANADNIRKCAAELAALAPDVIVAGGTGTVGPLLQATRTVPIVFV